MADIEIVWQKEYCVSQKICKYLMSEYLGYYRILGIIGFSRFLNYILEKYRGKTKFLIMIFAISLIIILITKPFVFFCIELYLEEYCLYRTIKLEHSNSTIQEQMEPNLQQIKGWSSSRLCLYSLLCIFPPFWCFYPIFSPSPKSLVSSYIGTGKVRFINRLSLLKFVFSI